MLLSYSCNEVMHCSPSLLPFKSGPATDLNEAELMHQYNLWTP